MKFRTSSTGLSPLVVFQLTVQRRFLCSVAVLLCVSEVSYGAFVLSSFVSHHGNMPIYS